MRGLLLAAAILPTILAGCTDPNAATADLPPGAHVRGEPYDFSTDIRDTGFEHPRLDAFIQAHISWRNAGKETHSVVSDDGRFAGSGPITPGAAFGFTFLQTGDYAYHCRYHPDMKGVVVVR